MSHLLHSGSFLQHSGPLDCDPDPDFEKIWAALPEPQFHRTSAKLLPKSPIKQPVGVRPSQTGPAISSKWLFNPIDLQSVGVTPQEQPASSQTRSTATKETPQGLPSAPSPPPPPSFHEIRIGDETHAGNVQFRRIVREFLVKQVHSTSDLALPKYTPSLYMKIVNVAQKQHPGIEFVVVVSSSFRAATTKEKIDYVRTCYENVAVEAATAPPVAYITATYQPL